MANKLNLTSSLAAVCAFCAIGYAAHYFETTAKLHLPAPSFKPVGPKFQPKLPVKEEGIYAPNTLLHKAKRLYKGVVWGSESVAVGPDGKLYMLDRYGSVLRAESDEKLERITHLGAGRPLGYHFDADSNLIICNAGPGLQMLEKGTNSIHLLTSEAPDGPNSKKLTPIRYANDLTIASDGTIYFTDSTDIPPALNAAGFYDTMASFMLTLFQGEYRGRLLKYEPKSGKTSFVSGGFFYANGVTLAKDESHILVAETCTVTIHRIWLKGPKAGTRDIFTSNLPGYPDGLFTGSDGSFWISIVNFAQPGIELSLRSRVLRWLAPRLPPSLKKIRPGTAIVQMDGDANVLRYLADATGKHLNTVAALTETKEGFFLGNLGGDYVSFLSKRDLPAPAKLSVA